MASSPNSPAALQLHELATRLELDFQVGLSPDGRPEQYLYSSDMRYRYAFARWWGQPSLKLATVWVGLNPATGDTEGRRRLTLERCINWSENWGSTGLVILNLFAHRATNPHDLKAVENAVGPVNNEVLAALTSAGQRTVAAWGAHGRLHHRSTEVGAVLTQPQRLGVTSRGEPRHPLYVPGEAELQPWTCMTSAP